MCIRRPRLCGSLGLLRGKESPTLGVIVTRSCSKRVRSFPTSDPVVDESNLRPIDLDEDIMGPSKPFFHFECSGAY